MPPLGVMAMAVAVDQHRFWVSALKLLPFLTSMSTATRVVPLGCRFILIPMLPVFDTDREIRARFDRQASATKQRPPSLVSSHPDAQNCILTPHPSP
jgi:hypothetical protein